MKVFINNHQKEVPENISLYQALEAAGITAQKGIAVAVNQDIVSKSEWTGKRLNENDKILIIKATQGG